MVLPVAGFFIDIVLGLPWIPKQGVPEELLLLPARSPPPRPLFAVRSLLLPLRPREGARHHWLRMKVGPKDCHGSCGWILKGCLSTSPDFILLENIRLGGILSL